jgi:predicted extracellular nuclease
VTSRSPKPILAVVALAAAGLLSACGGAQPGVAARVGDQTITVSQVNRITDSYCNAYERQLEGEGTVVPMSVISSNVVQTLAMTAAAEQLAEEFAVTPSPTYAAALANLEQTVASLEKDAADARVELERSVDYVTDVLTQVGRAQLEADGITEPSTDDSLAKGQDALNTWLATNEPEIDPQYGLALVELQPEVRDTSTSFAVSDLAKQGASGQVDPAYARSLPESQRCG